MWHGIDESCSAKTAAKIIGDDFEGVLISDGYKAYELIAKANATIVLALCWAHARRKFVEAEQHYPQCATAIDLIGQLYEIDRDTDNPARLFGDAKLAAIDPRGAARAKRAPPILDKLPEWGWSSAACQNPACAKPSTTCSDTGVGLHALSRIH